MSRSRSTRRIRRFMALRALPPSLRVLQILRRLASALTDLLGLELRHGIYCPKYDCPNVQKIHAAKVEF